MSRTMKMGLGILAWSVMAFGVLELRRIPGDYIHSFCGPWGCFPPLQALAAMHGFWILAIVPPAAWAIRTRSPRRLRILGDLLIALALIGIMAVLGWESWVWTRRFSAGWADFLPQRMAMAIATSADLPLIQTLGAGVVLRAVARRRVRLQSDNPIADTMTRETIRLNNTRSPDDRYSDSVSDLASNECGVPDDGRFLHATRALHADRAARSDR